jgi:hypothetical protein
MSQNSVNFAENQIQNILKYSSRPNILIAINSNSTIKNERLYEMLDRYCLKTAYINKLDLAVLDEYLLSSF